jgi:hypothetical protein
MKWMASIVFLGCALLFVTPAPVAAADKYCGDVRVRLASGNGAEICVYLSKGRVRCRSARWAFRSAFRHPDLQSGNKYLGDPPGWSCAAGRGAEPSVAGRCKRKRDGARIVAYSRRR